VGFIDLCGIGTPCLRKRPEPFLDQRPLLDLFGQPALLLQKRDNLAGISLNVAFQHFQAHSNPG